MPRFAANLTMLWSEVPFLDRFERAARAGFDAVEFQFPYACRASEIRDRLDANGLRLVLHNVPNGDWDGGERGFACHPGREREFRSAISQAIEYAVALGAPQLNCLAGKAPAGVATEVLRDALVANLGYAARELGRAGLKLLTEPINAYDVPGFFLNRTDQAAAILDDVGADNAFIQYDIYHAQRTEGELAASIERYLPRIGHMQLADNPGRHEPGSGEINWRFLFAHIDRVGYDGWIGCEYKPAHETDPGLAWRTELST